MIGEEKMDPNNNLASIREHVQTILGQYYDANSNGIDQDTAAAMAEDFDNLDVWLSKGGFLPLDWQKRRPHWRILTEPNPPGWPK
jgi:hypothetical protein